MPKFMLPLASALVVTSVGLMYLRPVTVEEFCVAAVCVSLLGYLPWTTETGLRRPASGAILGLVLGLPVAAVYHFWPSVMLFAAAGWVIGFVAKAADGNRLSIRRPSLSVAAMFSLTALAAVLVWIWQSQRSILAEIPSGVVNVDGGSISLRPSRVEILVEIDEKGEFIIGGRKMDGVEAATQTLREQIDHLLNAGVSPEQMHVVAEVSNQQGQSRIWLLRGAFDNVRGRSLNVGERDAVPRRPSE